MTDDQPHRSHLDLLEPLDIRAVESFSELLERMSKTSFGGRELGQAFGVLKEMAEDPDCTIVVTIAGAMSIAKMNRVLCEMIEAGLADLIVSTGAFLAHEVAQALGGRHYAHDPKANDSLLFDAGYNRVYDSLELDDNLARVDEFVVDVMEKAGGARPQSSFEIHQALGARLLASGNMPSVLGIACRMGVPVYSPAFTDSGIGLAVAIEALRNSTSKTDLDRILESVPLFNPFLDVYDYTRRIMSAKRLGIFTIGGGVPRNWAQQVGPFIDTINYFTGSEFELPRFQYGIRICPEPVHWGGLSGCTYSEGISWGKFVPPEAGGRFAEVHCDATIAWPIIIRAILESTPTRARSRAPVDNRIVPP
jgi:deoxyhypusine synthase